MHTFSVPVLLPPSRVTHFVINKGLIAYCKIPISCIAKARIQRCVCTGIVVFGIRDIRFRKEACCIKVVIVGAGRLGRSGLIRVIPVSSGDYRVRHGRCIGKETHVQNPVGSIGYTV